MANTDSGETASRRDQRDLLDCTRGYTPLPGIPDEFLDAKGEQREVWARFFDAFSVLAPGEIQRRFASADQHMREAGVTYRRRGNAADRQWPLSHLPLLIDEVEWKQISEGIAQRAELFELILREPLRRRPAGCGGGLARGRDRRQHRISALGLRHISARRQLSQPLCRRHRSWT